jgi:hypothetical protein
MSRFTVLRIATCIALSTIGAGAASAADVLIAGGKARPESLTVAPGGVVIVGSANGPLVYRIRAGAVTPEVFVDATAEGAGTSFLGMLADAAAGTLWSCQLTPVPNTTPPQRHSVVRGFDLATGAEKLRWNLPGDNSVCNDFTIGPDRTLYISDTANGRIFTLRTGAATADLFIEDRQTLNGIDGLTFLNGTLYVNNVRAPAPAAAAKRPIGLVRVRPDACRTSGCRAGRAALAWLPRVVFSASLNGQQSR